MKTSPILGLPIEQGTDTRRDFPSRVDEPRTQTLEKYTIPRFATTTARDTAIPAPADGQACYLTANSQLQVYRAGAWRPAARSRAVGIIASSIGSLASGWNRITLSSIPMNTDSTNYTLNGGGIRVAQGAMYIVSFAAKWMSGVSEAKYVGFDMAASGGANNFLAAVVSTEAILFGSAVHTASANQTYYPYVFCASAGRTIDSVAFQFSVEYLA